MKQDSIPTTMCTNVDPPYAPLDHTVLKPPRHRMMGGDKPRGGRPHGLGHAGRMRSGIARAIICSWLLVVSVFGFLCTVALRTALADEVITFEGGGSATKKSDGSIVGKCQLKAIWVGQGTTFTITMPDGQVLNARCQDKNYLVPYNDTYDFVATKEGDNKYCVLVDSSHAAYCQNSDGSRAPGYASDPNIKIQRVATIATIEADGYVEKWYWSPKVIAKGSLTISKSSTQGNLTNTNTYYSLQDAVYAIYSDAACTKPLGAAYELKTDASGQAGPVELNAGTYYVKEKNAPRGFKLDATVHEVTIRGGETSTLALEDEPIYVQKDVWIRKMGIPLDGSSKVPVGLEGAEFTISYYPGLRDDEDFPEQPSRTWVLKSDANGEVRPDAKHTVSKSGPFFFINPLDDNRAVVLPHGTLRIVETKAPEGYALEKTPNIPNARSAPVHLFQIGVDPFDTLTVTNEQILGGVRVTKKDAETPDGKAQGDATLSGAKFSIHYKGEKPIVIGNTSYNTNDFVELITTNEDGIAQTDSHALPCGTYEIQEVEAPKGYQLDPSFTQTFTISKDGEYASLENDVFLNTVARGGVKLQKVSRETLSAQEQGEATLKGAVYEVVSKCAHTVLVNNKLYEPDEVVATITTNENGEGELGVNTLPYGTYELHEMSAPTGYLLDESERKTISITEDGQIASLTGNEAFSDQIIRGDLAFTKVRSGDNAPMANIPFTITCVKTNECHTIVTDEHGVATTHGNKDVWFSGQSKDAASKPSNASDYALPYGTYQITEMPCDANRRYELVSFEVKIRENGTVIDFGNVVNELLPPPSISTSLTSPGGVRTTHAAKDTVLTDSATCKGLIPNEHYLIVGKLMDKEHCSKTDSPLTTKKVHFTARTTSSTVEVPFEVDTSNLQEKSLVCFEYLYYDDKADQSDKDSEDDKADKDSASVTVDEDGTADEEGTADEDGTAIQNSNDCLAKHEDPDDKNQTVAITAAPKEEPKEDPSPQEEPKEDQKENPNKEQDQQKDQNKQNTEQNGKEEAKGNDKADNKGENDKKEASKDSSPRTGDPSVPVMGILAAVIIGIALMGIGKYLQP